ncbi:MAG: DUF2834 domain-containing protein [Bacteroidota bacterium]
MKQNIYLLWTIIGTALPNIFVIKESIESGNIMLYARPLDTFQAMFVNNISSAFSVDLLVVVVMFLIWSYYQAKKYKIKGYGWTWIYTFVLGLAGGLPLFLYFREKNRISVNQKAIT